jgi:oxygen-independent coproporphyrinogen-3 oxidase
MGFGVDAHSMLMAVDSDDAAVRFSTSDSLDGFLRGDAGETTRVSRQNALEEMFFLGLRLNRGVDLAQVPNGLATITPIVSSLEGDGLIERQESRIRLTSQGRLLSNEVFARFLGTPEVSLNM